MNAPILNSNIERLFSLLNAASAFTIDEGAMLTDFETDNITGDPENQVVCFTWTYGECDFSESLTEGGIAAGVFESNGKFVANNSEGDKTVIRFFDVEALRLDVGKQAATRFFRELLNSAESLTGIAEVYGSRTLADLMYLQNAILSGGFIDHYPDESRVLEIVSALPSCEQWSKFIKIENLASSE